MLRRMHRVNESVPRAIFHTQNYCAIDRRTSLAVSQDAYRILFISEKAICGGFELISYISETMSLVRWQIQIDLICSQSRTDIKV